MMAHVAGIEIPVGCMVAHVTSGGIWRAIQLAQTPQLLDWFNDPKHGLTPLAWSEAWEMAKYTHTSCLVQSGVLEMTHPEARRRTWKEMVGSEIFVLRPRVSSIALHETVENMRLIVSAHAPYPKKELLASWWRAGKWLRKWLGTERFDRIFTDRDHNVCSGTYVECLLNACGFHATVENRAVAESLRAHHITALTPAFLAWCMPNVFEPIAKIEITA